MKNIIYTCEVYSRHTIFGKKRWHFRIVHSNQQIVAQGDPTGYHNKGDCLSTLNNLREGLGACSLVVIVG